MKISDDVLLSVAKELWIETKPYESEINTDTSVDVEENIQRSAGRFATFVQTLRRKLQDDTES